MASVSPTVAAAPTVVVQTGPTPTNIMPEQHLGPVSSGWVNFDIAGHHLSFSPMVCVLIGFVAVFAYWFWKEQHKDDSKAFDGWDLVMDTVPKLSEPSNWRRVASSIKLTYNIAFGVGCWVVIDEEMRGILTTAIFTPFLTLVFGTVAAKLIWDKPFDPAAVAAMLGLKKKDDEEH